jgi:hypothetical protein
MLVFGTKKVVPYGGTPRLRAIEVAVEVPLAPTGTASGGDGMMGPRPNSVTQLAELRVPA